MIQEGIRARKTAPAQVTTDPSRGLSMVSLSVATSLDALAVGVSLGVLRISIWQPAVVIGLVTALLSLLACGSGGSWAAKSGAAPKLRAGLRSWLLH